MNRSWILFHLTEAAEALQGMIADISADPDYSRPEFAVDMQHLYHHVNTAWNGREATTSEAEAGSDDLFNRWSGYPTDLENLSV